MRKRKWLSRVLVGAVLLAGLPLWAQEASVTEETRPLSGYDGGFFVRTADDNFRLKVKGALKTAHHYVRIPARPDTNTFRIQGASLSFGMKLFKDFEISTLLLHSTSGAGTTAPVAPEWYTSATYTPIPQFGIEVGAIQLPMDRQGETPGSNIGLTSRPITATQVDGNVGRRRTIARQAFGLPTSVGVRLFGDVSRFHYILGLANGEDWNGLNSSRDFAYSGRLAFDILGDPGMSEMDLGYSETPKLQVGVGAGLETGDAIDPTINFVTLGRSTTGSADLAFKWKGFAATTEWYWRKLKVLATATGAPARFTLDDVGYYADAGYFVIPKKLEVVGRAAQLFREGPDNNAYEFGGGVNWYIHGNNVKLQLDWSRLLDFDATEGEGNRPVDRIRTALTVRI